MAMRQRRDEGLPRVRNFRVQVSLFEKRPKVFFTATYFSLSVSLSLSQHSANVKLASQCTRTRETVRASVRTADG